MAALRYGSSGWAGARRRPSVLLPVALPVALLAVIPVWYIGQSAVDNGWTGIRTLVLRRRVGELLVNTLELAALVMLVSVVLGLGLAWLVERTDLPLRRIWGALLVAPLAVPAFVNSYAWVSLRPGIDGLGGAALITTLSYFPFVYLPCAAALRGLDPTLEESAAALGRTPLQVFVEVVLPQLRPALLGGALLVGLHILSEYGALAMLRFQTFTTVIFTQYKSGFNSSAATMMSGVLVMCCLLLVTLELIARGTRRYSRVGLGSARRHTPHGLGRASLPALAAVALTVALSIGVPGYALVRWLGHGDSSWGHDLVSAAMTTIRLGALAAVATTLAAFPLAWLAVRRRGPVCNIMERSAYFTSALPGVVTALALITVSLKYLGGLYQTTTLVIAAYVMMFLPRALVSLRTGVAQAPPELEEASRALGASGSRTFARVTLPLTAAGVASSAAFVFLAVCTELTAILLLAPTGTVTLATGFWTFSSALDYAGAAPYAAIMILLSAPMTYLLLQQSRRVRSA